MNIGERRTPFHRGHKESEKYTDAREAIERARELMDYAINTLEVEEGIDNVRRHSYEATQSLTSRSEEDVISDDQIIILYYRESPAACALLTRDELNNTDLHFAYYGGSY